MQNMKLPDITPAQLFAWVSFIVGQAVSWGVVSDVKAQLVISIGTAVLAVAMKLADAIIRNGRAKLGAAQVLSAVEDGAKTFQQAKSGSLSLHDEQASHEGARVVHREDTRSGQPTE